MDDIDRESKYTKIWCLC